MLDGVYTREEKTIFPFYADNVQLYLFNTHADLEIMLEIVKRYGLFSTPSIN